MLLIETLCKDLGLSHHQLAAFLHTDRSLVSKTLQGKKQLPPAALTQLARLGAIHLKMDTPGALEKPAMDDSTRQWIESKLGSAKTKLALALHNLQKITDTRHRAARLQRLLDALAEGADQLSARQKRWIENRRYELEQTTQRINSTQLHTIQLQIHLLEQEIAYLEQQLSG